METQEFEKMCQKSCVTIAKNFFSKDPEKALILATILQTIKRICLCKTISSLERYAESLLTEESKEIFTSFSFVIGQPNVYDNILLTLKNKYASLGGNEYGKQKTNKQRTNR